jgi:hypothetical protein
VTKFHVPANPMRVELDKIKKRQRERKAKKPEKITIELLYEMLSDVLENQARIMNFLEKGKFN